MHSTATGVSPSFTAHSSNNLADVAARVVEEFRLENGGGYDDIFNFNNYGYNNSEFSVPEKTEDENNSNNNDDDFEFAVVCTDVNSSTIPLFDRSLLLDVDSDPIKPVRRPLRKLFSEDRDFGSSSSSEADDLDGITPGTYCVWKPKTQSPDQRCNKSNSTGNSSRRWKFRDILYRSNSDSKETPFLLFKPLIGTNRKSNNNNNGKAMKVEKRGAVKDPANKAENRGAFTNVSRSNRTLNLF